MSYSLGFLYSHLSDLREWLAQGVQVVLVVLVGQGLPGKNKL